MIGQKKTQACRPGDQCFCQQAGLVFEKTLYHRWLAFKLCVMQFIFLPQVLGGDGKTLSHCSPSLISQAVSYPWLGEKILRAGRVSFNFAAQVADVDTQQVKISLLAIAPH